MWSALAENLSLIAFDLPGFGRSEGHYFWMVQADEYARIATEWIRNVPT
ncbi:MAG: hypothetical protein ABI884_04940 [Gemmatimonadota bacterium]